jgi:DNA-binding CsgD family transcriptional regulator
VALLRAQVAFASRHGDDAAPLLLAAARRLEPLDDALARETYLEAYAVARLADPETVAEVAQAAGRLPPAAHESRTSLLLDNMTARYVDGYAAAVPVRQRAVRAFRDDELPTEEGLRRLWLASTEACVIWDDESWAVLSARHVDMARAAGALSVLPLTLQSRAVTHVFAGELDTAAAMVAELNAVQSATGTTLAPYADLALAAWRGREQEAARLVEATLDELPARGGAIILLITQWARAVLANGAGSFGDAVVAAREAAAHPYDAAIVWWGMSELVEAAAKCGDAALAAGTLARLEAITSAAGTDWALGIQARCRALVTGEESGFREAIERLERTRIRGELARARLVYGEWLRRQDGREVDARAQLKIAYDLLSRIGAEAFAERARRELLAAGESIRRPAAERRDVLTPQEAQIARLAAEGRTNPEIGAQLFISPRTVEYHLRKVFDKLGIASRRELSKALS